MRVGPTIPGVPVTSGPNMKNGIGIRIGGPSLPTITSGPTPNICIPNGPCAPMGMSVPTPLPKDSTRHGTVRFCKAQFRITASIVSNFRLNKADRDGITNT